MTFSSRVVSLSLLAALALSGCHSSSLGLSPFATNSWNYAALQDLQKSGMQTIVEGDRLRVILPTLSFFNPQKQQVLTAQSKPLNELAKLIASHKQAQIQVIGYSNNIGTPADRMRRTLNEAQIIASYLWNAGISMDQISIKAMGASGTVASNATPAGAAANSRVEIWVN